jgi:hypothetical protein
MQRKCFLASLCSLLEQVGLPTREEEQVVEMGKILLTAGLY